MNKVQWVRWWLSVVLGSVVVYLGLSWVRWQIIGE